MKQRANDARMEDAPPPLCVDVIEQTLGVCDQQCLRVPGVYGDMHGVSNHLWRDRRQDIADDAVRVAHCGQSASCVRQVSFTFMLCVAG